MGEKGGDAELGGGCIAARVGDAGRFGNGGAVNELRKAIGPVRGEAIVCAEVDNYTFFAANRIDGIDEWSTNT